jgi:peptide deformylase
MVRRPQGVRISGRNLEGQDVTQTSCEHIARVWQHECDHLDGRLIIDRMSTMDRLRNRKALRALLKQAR